MLKEEGTCVTYLGAIRMFPRVEKVWRLRLLAGRVTKARNAKLRRWSKAIALIQDETERVQLFMKRKQKHQYDGNEVRHVQQQKCGKMKDTYAWLEIDVYFRDGKRKRDSLQADIAIIRRRHLGPLTEFKLVWTKSYIISTCSNYTQLAGAEAFMNSLLLMLRKSSWFKLVAVFVIWYWTIIDTWEDAV